MQKNADLQKFSHFPDPKMTSFKDRNSLGGRGPSAAIASFLNIQVLSFNLFTEEYPDMRKQDRQTGMVLWFLSPIGVSFFWVMLRFSNLDELVKFGEKVLGDDDLPFEGQMMSDASDKRKRLIGLYLFFNFKSKGISSLQLAAKLIVQTHSHPQDLETFSKYKMGPKPIVINWRSSIRNTWP